MRRRFDSLRHCEGGGAAIRIPAIAPLLGFGPLHRGQGGAHLVYTAFAGALVHGAQDPGLLPPQPAAYCPTLQTGQAVHAPAKEPPQLLRYWPSEHAPQLKQLPALLPAQPLRYCEGRQDAALQSLQLPAAARAAPSPPQPAMKLPGAQAPQATQLPELLAPQPAR